MKKVVGLLVVLLAIFLAGTMVMANEQLDRDFVKLRVYIGPYAQIQLDNDGYIVSVKTITP